MVCPLNIFTLNKTFDSFLDYHWRWLKSKKNEEIRIVQCSTDFYLWIAVYSANIIRQCFTFYSADQQLLQRVDCDSIVSCFSLYEQCMPRFHAFCLHLPFVLSRFFLVQFPLDGHWLVEF